MNYKKKTGLLLTLVVVLAFVLRLFKLGVIPPALEWDEVAIGYDAYSILKTGKDQFGQFLPLTFRSLDDYKPPLYEYLTVPSVAIFGLNEFSTRLPSAFFGGLSVLMTFLLIRIMFKKETIALLSSFFLAISPWHLQFSRAAFEVNLSMFIVICAVYFFLKAIDKPKYFPLSSLFFGIALFSYHSTRVITPLLLFSLLVLNWKKVFTQKKYVIISAIIYGIFFISFFPIMFSKDAQTRFSVTNISNIFYNDAAVKQLDVARAADQEFSQPNLFRLFHGTKPILFKLLLANYIVHFSPDFLFLNADVPLHHAPDFGLIYLTELPFILYGIYIYFRRFINKENAILIIWFLLAPLPAAVTLQVPHAVRTELFLPTFQAFTGLGLFSLVVIARKYLKRIFFIFPFLLVTVLGFDFNKYLHQYYIHIPYEVAKQWMFGRKEAALFADSVKDQYDKVIVSVALEHPHMFFLYYLKYDPVEYLKGGGTVSGGWAEDRNKFDKYEFKFITYEELQEKYPNSLIIGLPKEFPRSIETLKTIYYPDGTEALKIIKI